MNKKPLFPVFLDLSEKKIVVIGFVQDPVCLVRKLAPYTKMVTLICPKDLPEIAGPEMPENIKEAQQPVQLGRPVIASVEELKRIAGSLFNAANPS